MSPFKGFLRYRKAGRRYGFRSKELIGFKQWKVEWERENTGLPMRQKMKREGRL